MIKGFITALVFILICFGCEQQENPYPIKGYDEVVNVTPEMATDRITLFNESNGDLYKFQFVGINLKTGDGRLWNVHDFHATDPEWVYDGVPMFVIEYWRPIEQAGVDDPFHFVTLRCPMIHEVWGSRHRAFMLSAPRYALWLVDVSSIQEVFEAADFSGDTGRNAPSAITLTDTNIHLWVEVSPSERIQVARIVQQGYTYSRFGVGYDWIMVFALRVEPEQLNKNITSPDGTLVEIPTFKWGIQ